MSRRQKRDMYYCVECGTSPCRKVVPALEVLDRRGRTRSRFCYWLLRLLFGSKKAKPWGPGPR